MGLCSLSACSSLNGEKDKNKLDVYASCYPIYDLVKQIGGEKIDVHLLPAFGLEPHEYEPTPRDLAKLLEASHLFANGLGMEKWMDDLNESLASKDVKAIKDKTSYLGNSLGDKIQKVEDVIDPHAWLSTSCASIYLDGVSDVLTSIDPDNADFYAANLEDAKGKLKVLDEEIKEAVKDIENKKLVVSHAAFGYFASEYGFEQIYLSGLSDEEPSVRDVQRVIDAIKQYGVKTVYAEELDGSDALSRIQEETGCELKLLYTLETLEKEEVDEGEDYYSIMRKNIATLKEGNKK